MPTTEQSSFIRRTLNREEALVYQGSAHWLAFLAAPGFVGLAGLIVYLMARSARSEDVLLAQTQIELGDFLGIFLLGLAGLMFLNGMITWLTTEVAITNQRVIYKRGWISTRVNEVRLNRIEGLALNQSLPGRMFDYGDLIVSGTGTMQARLAYLAQPARVRRVLQEQMQSAPEAAAPAPAKEPVSV